MHQDFDHQYTATITLRFNHLPDAELAVHDLLATRRMFGLVCVDGVEYQRVPQR